MASAPAALRLSTRAAFCVALVTLALGLAACGAERAGDLGRQRPDYISKNVFAPIDRHLLAGGRMELSSFPLNDQERRMYDVIWRFFSAPYARDWTLFGAPRISPVELASGKAFDKTDRYYAWLRRTDFKSARTRYNAMISHTSADLQTLGTAFEAICAVKRLDIQRRTAADALAELGTDERVQLDMRLNENAHAIANFALALDYHYQSYSYALKRLLVESPDESARDIDANLSRLAIRVDAARAGDYCAANSRGVQNAGSIFS